MEEEIVNYEKEELFPLQKLGGGDDKSVYWDYLLFSMKQVRGSKVEPCETIRRPQQMSIDSMLNVIYLCDSLINGNITNCMSTSKAM